MNGRFEPLDDAGRLAAFEEKYVPEPNSGCWIWIGATRGVGYACFWDGTRKVSGHRWSFERFVGPIPPGLQLDHVRARGCVGPACVNPWHLEPVTGRENTLRAGGWPAQNLAKQTCPQGHPYSGGNLGRVRGGRFCRRCRNDRSIAWAKANRERQTKYERDRRARRKNG